MEGDIGVPLEDGQHAVQAMKEKSYSVEVEGCCEA
jgi:hypothetical protein